MFKNKKKISESEAYDSLLFPIVIETMSKVNVESDNDDENISEELLIKFKYNTEAKNNISFVAIVKDFDIIETGGIPFINKMTDSDKDEYLLSLKSFLQFTNSLYIMKTADGKKIEYLVRIDYQDQIFELTFYDSDMYSSVVNYIINNASTEMYKSILKG